MNFVFRLLDYFSYALCRHEWIRDRRANGELGLRCMKCMRRKEHTMVRLIRWRPKYYREIEPAHVPGLPPQIEDRKAA